jgi:hypothetical protein
MRICALILATALAIAFGLPATSQATSYKYTDKDGLVHFTDNPYDLPEPQRSEVLRKLHKKEVPKSDPSTGSLPPIPPGARLERLPTAGGNNRSGADPLDQISPNDNLGNDSTPTRLDESSKESWELKAQKARERVDGLEVRCKAHESKRDQSNRQALMFAKPGARGSSKTAAEQLDKCKQELKQARHWLDTELPAAARKAGVPPAWIKR